METTIIKQDETELAVRAIQMQDDRLITLQKIDSASSADKEQNWETPIPLKSVDLPEFPVYELPSLVANYVLAVAETTQTSIDMSAVASIAVLATALQGKFVIEGKRDWIEPLNLYTLIIAPPAERKSAVMSLMSEPLKQFEKLENKRLEPYIEQNRMEKSVLLKRRNKLEKNLTNITMRDTEYIQDLSQQISDFQDIKPIKLFCDDVTPEKLSGTLADNNGRISIMSSEGGLFDMLAGRYGNSNIDIFLKAHAGDSIRIDRQTRESEYIENPAVTTMIFSQPAVISKLMSNSTFISRGLCARFLYSLPTSTVGTRRFDTKPISEDDERVYYKLLNILLKYEPDEVRIIRLSDNARKMLKEFSEKIEPMLIDELADIADFAGKFVGAVLRIAGLLYITEYVPLYAEELILSEDIMESAIIIGEYFLEHAKSAYQLMGADKVNEQCKYILRQLQKSQPEIMTVRDVMRLCQRFKTAESAKIPVARLCDYGYLRELQTDYSGSGRPQSKQWEVNPDI